jgi:DNA polymerase-1
LLAELKRLRVRFIAAMGAKSLQILTGKRKIFDWMGAPIQGAAFDEKGKAAVLRKKDPAPDKSRDFRKWTLLPMLHPAFCLPHREPAWLPVFHIHLLRAWQFANGTPPPWKWPNIYLPGLYDAKHNREALRALKRIRKRALKGGTIAPDVETNHKDPLQADLRNIGISDDFDAVSITYPLLDTKSVHECDQLMRSILADERIKKEMQNGGYDDLNLHRNGYEINGWDFDTLIGYRLIAPQLLSSLAIQSAIEFPCERWKDEFGEGKDRKGAARFIKSDPILRGIYNAKDCYTTHLHRKTQEYRLAHQVHNGRELFDKYLRLYKIAIEMRRVGVRVDPTKFFECRRLLRRRRNKAKKRLMERARIARMKKFNPNSRFDIRKMFEQKLKIKPFRWSKKTGQPSWDAKALQTLCTSHRPAVRETAHATLAYREHQKLLRTYVECLPTDETSFIHPDWMPIGRTGRWTSKEPNAQNVPGWLRILFVVDDFNKWFVCADWSQLELRILAYLSGDQILIDAYDQGLDVHTLNACALFGVTVPTKEQRTLAKRFVYGLNYGGTAETIHASLVVDFPGLTLLDVARLMKMWKRAHPAIVRWQAEQFHLAQVQGYTEAPISGRRHHFYGNIKPTEVANDPIQTTAADWVNDSILDLYDELVLQGPRPIRLFRLMKKHMEAKRMINGKLRSMPVDFKFGKNWGLATKIKTEGDMRRVMREEMRKAA